MINLFQGERSKCKKKIGGTTNIERPSGLVGYGCYDANG
jgi:hypothetical protein